LKFRLPLWKTTWEGSNSSPFQLDRSGYCRVVTRLALHEVHVVFGARFGELSGQELVADYGDIEAEHSALATSVGVIDLSFRGRICLTGNDRVRLLHGQVTNDVKGLPTGSGCYAALVTAKGRIEADLNIYALANELLLDFEPGLTQRIQSRMNHYIVADDVQVVDVAPHYGLLSLQGPRAAEVLRADQWFDRLPEFSFGVLSKSDPAFGDLYLVHRTRCGWPKAPGAPVGFDLFVPAESMSRVFDKLVVAAKVCGGRAVGWAALEQRRIEAGVPRFGMDLDETNLAPEGGDAFVSHAIHYAKGCYIGQEIIARIRTYGQVSRAFRGLRFTDKFRDLPPRGTKLQKEGKDVGVLTSSLWSPRHQAVLALGLVRRECHELGTELMVDTGEKGRSVRIVELPFSA